MICCSDAIKYRFVTIDANIHIHIKENNIKNTSDKTLNFNYRLKSIKNALY